MTGDPAPIDFAYRLPPNWHEVLAEWSRAGPYEEFRTAVADFANAARPMSITSSIVQDLALRATGIIQSEGELPLTLQRAFSTIEESGIGEWYIVTPLREALPSPGGLHPFDFGRRSDNLFAEWFVLAEFVGKGWQPIPAERGQGNPDWVLAKGDVQIELEVSRKSEVQVVDHALSWAIKGMGMLPGLEWVSSLAWSFGVAQSKADPYGSRCLDWLLEILPGIRDLLRWIEREGLPHQEVAVGGRGRAIVEGPMTMLVHSTDPDLDISMDLRRNPWPDFMNPGGGGSFWIPDGPRDQDRTDLQERVLERIIRKKAQQLSGNPTRILIVAWELPEDTETVVDEAWLKEQMVGLPADYAEVPLILWPLGRIEWGSARFIPNPMAESILSGDL
jgi:hypothetical protein